MEVTFRDPWQGPPQANPYVMRVTYRWRFRSEGIKFWATVEPLARTIQDMQDPYCYPVERSPCNPAQKTFAQGVPFVKEPKFAASLRGGRQPSEGPIWTRIGAFSGNGLSWSYEGSMRGEPQFETNVHPQGICH